MARSSYPTDDDVAALAATVSLPAGFTFAGLAAAAVDEWERRTGYHPFLGSGAVETRVFDPPGPNRRPEGGLALAGFSLLGGGRVLDLEGGLYGLETLTTGVGVGSPGTTLVQGTDFWLEPLNAVTVGGPWRRVRFRAPVFGGEASVVIVGSFGFGATIPEDAWQAIARLGCGLGLDAVVEGLRSGSVEWAEDDVREKLDPALVAGLGSSLRGWAERVLLQYRCV